MLINERIETLESYARGKIKSKVYTDEEIEKKREYFLSLVPPKESEISLKRWYYEIERVFELNNKFKECPDMWFYHLETYFY